MDSTSSGRGAPPSPGRPDRPSARVTSRSRTRTASARFFSRDTADTRLAEERLLDRRCALRRRLLAVLCCPPPRVGVSARQIKSSSRRAELDARRARDWRHRRTIRESRSITRLSGEEPRARSPGRHALTPLPHSHTPRSAWRKHQSHQSYEGTFCPKTRTRERWLARTLASLTAPDDCADRPRFWVIGSSSPSWCSWECRARSPRRSRTEPR